MSSALSFSEQQIRRLYFLLDAVSARIVAFYMRGDVNARLKSDGTPLTDVDLHASAFLRARLPSVLDVPVICEESFVDTSIFTDVETYWLVDPIDGTKGFVQRNGQFCVCVALIHAQRAVVGAIYEPLTQTCWFATHLVNAPLLRKWVNGHVCPIVQSNSNKTKVNKPFIISTGHGKVSSKLQRFIAAQGLSNYEHTTKGSALKFADIVEGKTDLYVKISTTAEWDTAAGQVLVETIGGSMLDDTGQPLRYGARDTVINPNFVACAPTLTATQITTAWQALT